jgi:DNA-nicking Smr family endonuclease
MVDDKRDQEQEKSFVVKDKRFSAKKEEKVESQIKEEGKTEEAPREDTSAQKEPLPEIDFTSFIFSLSTSALIQLGEIEDPFTQKLVKNLPLAKQTIDLIGMLKEKAKGNLSPEEEKVIDYILYDLRMRYVKAAE